MTDLSLTTSRVINASPERIFDAWLDPAMLMRFMTPGPGMTAPKATNDPVVGGRFDILMKAGDQEIPHAGTYMEIDRPKRLVFTWESPFSMEGSTVTLDLALVEGGTEVTLTHVKFPSEESRDNHNAGWTAILEALSGAVVEAAA